jgi:hypothetical protein
MTEPGPAVVWTRAAVQHVFAGVLLGRVEAVMAALDAGLPPSTTFGCFGATLLHWCFEHVNRNVLMHGVVLRLLASDCDPNARDIKGVTPVHEACLSGNLEMVQAVVAAGGRLNSLNDSDETPLFYAVISAIENAERWRLLQWLADCPDMDWWHRNWEGKTALELAMSFRGGPGERCRVIAAAAMETQRERTARWTPLRAAFVGAVAVVS